MKTQVKKLDVKTNPLFKFEQQKKAFSKQRPSDTTLTITVTGDTIFTSVIKVGK